MKKFITVKTKTACYYYMKATNEISEIFALKKKKDPIHKTFFSLSFFNIYFYLSRCHF